jgi:serine/threonine-protein kinase
MQPQELAHWKAADAAFDALLDLAPAAREPALRALDLPEPVRLRVRRLLAADAAAALPADAPADGFTGRRIGRWVIECEIGRGGMSMVFRAHAHEAPDHLAALKVITLGALAGPGFERFRREQAILARLRHPHITTLLDAGVEPDGTPWLAMALVEGRPVDAWCEARGVDLRGRVRLLLDVCAAVAHAHGALVVHRDLKPSNVLVDADGHVRLLDFGIARLTDDTLGEATATHWRALSPSYAAPEQFDGAPAATAMDVFGLGALLYALCCGVAPRDGRGGGAPIEPPSRRARPADGPTHLPPATALRGDLDAIAMRALADDPAARYASAEALADDLARWLDGAPVQARGAGIGYRVRRTLRRHWPAWSMAAITVASLLAGAGVALDRAREAEAQAARATAVQEFLLGIFRASQTDASGEFMLSKREIAEEAARRLAAAERAGEAFDPALSLALARVLADLGLDDAAQARLDAVRARLGPARAGDPLAIDAAVQLARLRIGRNLPAEAEPLLREALDALRGEPAARSLPTRSLLAMAVYYQVRIDEARALSDGVMRDLDAGVEVAPSLVVDALLDRAVILRASGEIDAAIAAARRAADTTASRFGDDSPRLVRALDLLGTLQRRSGRVLDALASQRRALEIARRSAGSIGAVRLSNLARSVLLLGDARQAATLAGQALERRREELGDGHPALAETEEPLVLAAAELGDPARADAFYARTLPAAPSQPMPIVESRRRMTYGRLLLARGESAAAVAQFEAAARAAGDYFPARAARAAAQVGLGCAALATGRAAAAHAALAAAVRELAPASLELEERIALEHCTAALAAEAGDLEAALARREALDAALAPLLGEASPRRAAAWRAQADLLDRMGRAADAAALRARAARALAAPGG